MFLTNVCEKYELRAKVIPTYWTALVFDVENDPNRLHVTHKYLGILDDFEVDDVVETIDRWLGDGWMPVRAVWDQEDQFGPERDVRVLKPTDPTPVTEHSLLAPLRVDLDQFREDDWESYEPHVSTEREQIIVSPLVEYVLMYDEEVVRSWPAL